MEELSTIAVDSYGVGTRLVSGSGAPSAQLVYKRVARAEEPGEDGPLMPVAKTSTGKATVGGRKTAVRVLGDDGFARAELVGPEAMTVPTPGRRLQVRVI